jgi:hypothetical protein
MNKATVLLLIHNRNEIRNCNDAYLVETTLMARIDCKRLSSVTSREAAESVERFDPEGDKSPGGEWRQRKQPSEPASEAATGLSEEAAFTWGKPVEAAEQRADRAVEPAGRPRSSRSGPLTPEWGLPKRSNRCGRGKGRYERPAPLRRETAVCREALILGQRKRPRGSGTARHPG